MYELIGDWDNLLPCFSTFGLYYNKGYCRVIKAILINLLLVANETLLLAAGCGSAYLTRHLLTEYPATP